MVELSTVQKLAKAKTLAIKLQRTKFCLPIQKDEGEILIDLIEILEADLHQVGKLFNAANLTALDVLYLKTRLQYHYWRGEDEIIIRAVS